MSEEYYWGEITQAEMQNINSVSLTEGWSHAVNSILAEKHPGLVGMVTDEDRVDWIHRFPTSELEILDIGSGWGQASFLLASRHSHSVTSLELIPERVEFQSIRAKQEGLEKLKVVQGNILDADIESDKFDLVSLIGVLEWIGIDQREDDPREVQKLALTRIHKLLKNDGAVCIGIENRIGFNNFLGARDHSGFAFTSLMPRRFASWYLKIRNAQYRSNTAQSTYRTYTYGASGFRRLLNECGFSDVEILVSHPHYAHPRCLVPYKNSAIKRYFWKDYTSNGAKDVVFSSLFRVLSMLGIGHVFAPHFVIIARK
jgi:2-polyprenyl-3-methyl-5-hydroxy-6-metoxy-1,4-benzoquinol methylase